MPVSCSAAALTGADGLVEFAPAGVTACVLAADITAAGVAVGADKRFKVGDPVTLTYPQGATPDTTLTAADYFVQDYTAGVLNLSSTLGGAAVVPTADAADFGAGHADIKYTGTTPVCSVQEWSLDLSKDQVDVTTLPCSIGSGGGKVAPVRKQQGTFLNGEGSMTLLFTGDQTSMGNRLLADSIMADSTVYAKLYINAVAGAGGMAPAIDDASSMYYAGKVTLLGFSITSNTSDALTAEVSFSLADTPDAIFGVTL